MLGGHVEVETNEPDRLSGQRIGNAPPEGLHPAETSRRLRITGAEIGTEGRPQTDAIHHRLPDLGQTLGEDALLPLLHR